MKSLLFIFIISAISLFPQSVESVLKGLPGIPTDYCSAKEEEQDKFRELMDKKMEEFEKVYAKIEEKTKDQAMTGVQNQLGLTEKEMKMLENEDELSDAQKEALKAKIMANTMKNLDPKNAQNTQKTVRNAMQKQTMLVELTGNDPGYMGAELNANNKKYERLDTLAREYRTKEIDSLQKEANSMMGAGDPSKQLNNLLGKIYSNKLSYCSNFGGQYYEKCLKEREIISTGLTTFRQTAIDEEYTEENILYGELIFLDMIKKHLDAVKDIYKYDITSDYEDENKGLNQ